jgi:cytochrome P450/NADPH-cytochrome P450 reductase
MSYSACPRTLMQAFSACLHASVSRASKRYILRFLWYNASLTRSVQIVLSAGDGPTPLPVDKPVVLASLLSGYVELAQPASIGDLRVLLKYASTDNMQQDLETLIAEHGERVMSVRLSALDVLERHPDLDVPFPAFLQVLPAMRVRQYSISSSPLWDAKRATLTISVVRAAASLSAPTRKFAGVSSNFLANLVPGDRVALSVRPSGAPFHLPSDPAVPVVMFCAGSGLAPFRGFCQERALQRAGGRATGSMLLFYGCRAPDEDYLYADAELAEWAEAGVVDIRPAFSRRQDESAGCKYVQE